MYPKRCHHLHLRIITAIYGQNGQSLEYLNLATLSLIAIKCDTPYYDELPNNRGTVPIKLLLVMNTFRRVLLSGVRY